jgi:hypothetical protein
MKTYRVGVQFSGEVVLEIKAKSEKEANLVADKISNNLHFDRSCWVNDSLEAVDEMLNIESTYTSYPEDGEE